MFEAYSSQMKNFLLPAEQCHPFPRYEERDAWEAVSQEYREHLISGAEQYLNYGWPTALASVYMDFYRNGNRTRYEDIIFRQRRNPLVTLVTAELAEGKGRFIDDIINGIWTTLDEATWLLPAHNWANPTVPLNPKPLVDTEDRDSDFVDLFSAECGSMLSWIYYMLGNRLDQEAPQITARIRGEVTRKVLDPFLRFDNFFYMGNDGRPVNNWNTSICSNILTTALYLAPEEDMRVALVEKSMKCVENFIAGYYPDGGCDEGPGYWNGAGGCLFEILDILSAITGGKVNLFGDPLVKNILTYIYRAHIDGAYFVNYADASPVISSDSSLLYRIGKAIEDPKMVKMAVSFYREQKKNGGCYACCGQRFRLMKRYFLNPAMEAETESGFAYVRDTWLPGIQVLYARMREGSAEGLYLSAKGGHNAESHNHNDIGSFVLYCDGKPAIIDIGSGIYSRSYFNSKRYTIPMMQSQYHNLPIVGGAGQLAGAEYKAENVDCTVSEENCRMHLDIAAAYGEESGILSWNRTFVLNRKEETVTLEDEFRLKEKKDVDFVLMLCKEPAVSGNVMTIPVDDASAAEVTFDPSLTPEVTVFDVSWDKKLTRIWDTQLYRVIFHSAAPADAGTYRMVFRKKA